MSFYAFDPRLAIIAKIGTAYDLYDENRDDLYCILVRDTGSNEDIYIPMMISEEIKTDELPTMPYVEFSIQVSKAEPHDVGAATRKMEMIIDVHIWFTDMNNITVKTFGNTVRNKLADIIRVNQHSVSGVQQMYFRSPGRLITETRGRQVVFHYVMELYARYHDACD